MRVRVVGQAYTAREARAVSLETLLRHQLFFALCQSERMTLGKEPSKVAEKSLKTIYKEIFTRCGVCWNDEKNKEIIGII